MQSTVQYTPKVYRQPVQGAHMYFLVSTAIRHLSLLWGYDEEYGT